ncbi:CrcB-like protein-domain-containing protein [Suillus paluster]|uniref:CrcB-like protein-domain-containing protein n=1 Tax=Suillus paluster TaxID=48578 RepID=UPI001B8641B3|nr:CrcB-like protein-domain-containing protein [Suillus paluster]KAG1752724.1 CrcB-like protein-domain-containing protein [Suillus paluster]
MQGKEDKYTQQTPFSTSQAGTGMMVLNPLKRTLTPLDYSLRRRSDVGSIIARHQAIDDANSLASIDRPPSEVEELPPAKIYHPLSIHVLALLMPASIFGVLARLGLQALATYNGQSVFPLAYVQATGCFIMGIGLKMKVPFGNFYGPLYTAMTTGFCGSLTTFSGWQVDVFDSWVNTGQFHRGGLRDVVDGLTKTWVTLVLSLASLQLGIYVCGLAQPYFPAPRPPTKNVRYTLTILAILTYAAAFPAYFLLPHNFRHQTTAALLFSYPGTLTRYLLSLNLNPRLKTLPLGTYMANSLGTALLGFFHVLQGLPSAVSPNTCSLLQGLGDGYCGCLTTISTFAAEIIASEGWKAWTYTIISWITGQLLLLVIMGSSFWGGRVKEQMTCSFQTS